MVLKSLPESGFELLLSPPHPAEKAKSIINVIIK
jgi:hypothetical protein